MNADLDDRIRRLVAEELNQAPAPPAFHELTYHPVTQIAPRERRPARRAILVALAAIGLVVATVGIVALARSDSKAPTAITPADTTPVPYRLDIATLPTLRFDADTYEAPAGPVEIHYVSQGGTHTLVIAGPGLSPTEVGTSSGSAGPDGTPTPGKVVTATLDLERGTYMIYCAPPGHRAAGEEATLIVR